MEPRGVSTTHKSLVTTQHSPYTLPEIGTKGAGMAGKKKMGDKWQYTFKRAGILDKPLYLTFSNESEGDEYARKLDALLDRGIVPTQHQVVSRITTIENLIRQYLRDAHVKQKDIEVLNTVSKTVGDKPLSLINANWVDGWITDMKRIHKLKPATIRAKVGALARCTDWGTRKGMLIAIDRPLRTLPEGYANYTELDSKLAGVTKSDTERDRRLEPGEYERIVAVIEKGVLPRKQRPYIIEDKEAVRDIFDLALESAMRLREMYTITTDQSNVDKKTVFLDRTKNGSKRQVPLSSVALKIVKRRVESSMQGAIFPWWNGDLSQAYLKKTSNYLSHLFSEIFEAAGCGDFNFHDCRHEAISRLFERTTLPAESIMKISGHISHRMMMRYLALRGSDLAEKLW